MQFGKVHSDHNAFRHSDVTQVYIISSISYLQQNMDQSEQLQRQLAALDDTPATVTRQVERLQEEVRKEFGQIKVMEQQVILQLHLSMLSLLASV